MENLETLVFKNSSGHWVACTSIPLWGDRVLDLTTLKRTGNLSTTAAVCRLEKLGCGLVIKVNLLRSDFHKTLIEEPCHRVTELAVKSQHERIITQAGTLAAVMVEAKSHYGRATSLGDSHAL